METIGTDLTYFWESDGRPEDLVSPIAVAPRISPEAPIMVVTAETATFIHNDGSTLTVPNSYATRGIGD